VNSDLNMSVHHPHLESAFLRMVTVNITWVCNLVDGLMGRVLPAGSKGFVDDFRGICTFLVMLITMPL